jgi:hypothetical protein
MLHHSPSPSKATSLAIIHVVAAIRKNLLNNAIRWLGSRAIGKLELWSRAEVFWPDVFRHRSLTSTRLLTKEVAMRKYLVLALIPMLFAAMACQKTEQTAPETAASPAAEASPAGEMASPAAGASMEASPAASPAAP